jgi:hypothetical protein
MKRYLNFIQKGLMAVALLCWLSACDKKKKPSLAGNEKIEVDDFITSFKPLALPFIAADTNLRKKDNDSLLISKAVLLQFIPDTTLTKLTGKGTKFKAYPIGQAVDENGVHYLFLKTVAGDKKLAHLLTFNKKQQFIAAMPLIKPGDNHLTTHYGGVDKRFSITRSVQQKKIDGSVMEGKEVFVLNEAARNFLLIMTDALGGSSVELINPIDTLPITHKYAADYLAGKMNLVAVRDGTKPDRIRFFVHIEKNNSTCIGEIKGEAFWKTSNTAFYTDKGEACSLVLKFNGNSVTIQEENCGAKRNSIDCTFDATFVKQKYKKNTKETNLKKSNSHTAPKTVKK